jgi:hypothetical protein
MVAGRMRPCQNADRLMAAEHDLVEMLKSFDAPRERGAERGAEAIAD